MAPQNPVSPSTSVPAQPLALAKVSNPSSRTRSYSFARLRRLLPGRDTVTAGLEDSWELFKRVSGELPVPGLSSALEGVSFLEEKYSMNKKNKKALNDLKEKLQRFNNTVNYYREEDIISKLKQDDSNYGLISIVGKKLEAVANEYKEDSQVSTFVKSNNYAEKIADVVAQMSDMIAGIMVRVREPVIVHID
ncbi:hypothetical protein VKT23_010795 [Stygiomarasmius scandens]|uniref:Uncharacterized protein n=1 Tax=Marasmiellus scandens TaxID=2682957 RepID=A0ABR1JCV4_9AGAR